MPDFQVQMSQVVGSFVSQITDLARAAARDMIDQALGAGKGPAVQLSANVLARGMKRKAEDIEATAKQFMDFVTANPGLRIEQINKQLNTTTKDLALPIRKLLADGVLKTRGSRRSTTYFDAASFNGGSSNGSAQKSETSKGSPKRRAGKKGGKRK